MNRTYHVRSRSGHPYEVVMSYGDLEIVVYVTKDLDRAHEIAYELTH